MIWQNWKRNVIGDFPLRSIIHWIGCIRTRTSFFSQYLGELDVDDDVHGIDDDVHGVDDDVQGVDDDVNDGEGCVLIEMLRAPQSLVVPHVPSSPQALEDFPALFLQLCHATQMKIQVHIS